jgi:hypothetical protein
VTAGNRCVAEDDGLVASWPIAPLFAVHSNSQLAPLMRKARLLRNVIAPILILIPSMRDGPIFDLSPGIAFA